MYGKSVAMGALALAGTARAHGLDLDLDLNLAGGSAPDLARCAEDKCYGSLVRANVKLDVAGICAGLFAVVGADISALPVDLTACVSLDVLFGACQCIANGGGVGSGDGSGNGGAATTESRAFPVITMTGGDGMASMTGGDGMATTQTGGDGVTTTLTGADDMASVTASMTASVTASLTSSAATVTPTASHEEHLTVSTVTTTKWHSVVDCPTTVTDCPTVTSQVEVYTTTCPVSGPHATGPVGSGDDNNNMPGGGGNMPGYTLVKTLYSTNWHTVTKCSETISNCVSGPSLSPPFSTLCQTWLSPPPKVVAENTNTVPTPAGHHDVRGPAHGLPHAHVPGGADADGGPRTRQARRR